MIGLELTGDAVRAIAVELADELERRGLVAAGAAGGGELLTVDEAAAYIRAEGKNPAARIYNLVHAGRLEAERDGRRLLFRRSQLDAYLAGGAP